MEASGRAAARVAELLARPMQAVLAVNRSQRPPQLTVVWFHWDGDAFFISTTRDRAKTRHIRRDPNVALLVNDYDRNWYITAYGRAELRDDGNAELTRILFDKYLPGTDPTSAARDPNRIVVRIRPDRIVTSP
jgi:PPOX class probable F420-dependent enzyme